MNCDIPNQIRARLDAIAAERSRLDDEERRLKKALGALEETTVQRSADSQREAMWLWKERMHELSFRGVQLFQFVDPFDAMSADEACGITFERPKYKPTFRFIINQVGPAY